MNAAGLAQGFKKAKNIPCCSFSPVGVSLPFAISYRAQLGRLGGSRWGWVLQIKLRCHTNHRSLGHHHHRSPSLIREVPGERTRHHIPQVFSLWCPHVRRPKSGRHLGDLQDSCLARQNKSLTRHYERRDIVPRPTRIDSYSPAKFQFLRIHRPILCRFPVF